VIELVAAELALPSPTVSWGLRVQSIAAEDMAKAVGEFVAAVAYTENYDRHGSWANVKKRYQQYARRYLCAEGKPALDAKTA
jgi:hypothetical protein